MIKIKQNDLIENRNFFATEASSSATQSQDVNTNLLSQHDSQSMQMNNDDDDVKKIQKKSIRIKIDRNSIMKNDEKKMKRKLNAFMKEKRKTHLRQKLIKVRAKKIADFFNDIKKSSITLQLVDLL